jgi:hypothetical protein
VALLVIVTVPPDEVAVTGEEEVLRADAREEAIPLGVLPLP